MGPGRILETAVVARQPRRREGKRLMAGAALAAEAVGQMVDRGPRGLIRDRLVASGAGAGRLAEGAPSHLGVALQAGHDRVPPGKRKAGLGVGDEAEGRLPVHLVV